MVDFVALTFLIVILWWGIRGLCGRARTETTAAVDEADKEEEREEKAEEGQEGEEAEEAPEGEWTLYLS